VVVGEGQTPGMVPLVAVVAVAETFCVVVNGDGDGDDDSYSDNS